ncbi:MAG: YdcF family protein [Stellaceae bacterium]
MADYIAPCSEPGQSPGVMMFLLDKAFWSIAAPGDFLVLLLAIGTLSLLVTHRRRGMGLIAAATIGFLAIWILPIGDWLLLPLEDRFPPPAELPAQLEGIIVLGGAVDEVVSQARGQIKLTEAGDRLATGVLLAQRHPAARVLLVGGSGRFIPGEMSEAEAMRRFFVARGVDPTRISLETRSRTTYENAVFAAEVARPQPGEAWLLVTSAAHMPRAVGCFRRAGWSIIPYPVDYRTTGHERIVSGLLFADELVLATGAVREWVGLAAYRILGRTDALFPGPS